MSRRAYQMMSAVASGLAVVVEPMCAMLWVMLATTVLYATSRSTPLTMFNVALMSLVYGAVQSTAGTAMVAISYACFFASLESPQQAIAVDDVVVLDEVNTAETP